MMILREYLYVDTTTVRGVLAQLDAGIVESETSNATKDRRTGAGVRGVLEHSRSLGETVTISKAMADGFFPQLEEALEAEGWLRDISQLVADDDAWRAGRMPEELSLDQSSE